MRDFPGNLGRWSLIGKISSGQLRSWTRVWFMKASWSIQMNAFPWYSTTSFGNSQIDRPCKGGVLWPLWDSWVLYPSWIIWGVSWRFNGSACDDKPGSPYRPIPRGTQWTIAWPCPSLWYHLLPHLPPLPPSWWVVVMVYHSELGGLLLPPGSLPDPKYESSRCLPMWSPLCAPPGWWTGGCIPLYGIS